jgi:hypothetical protein
LFGVAALECDHAFDGLGVLRIGEQTKHCFGRAGHHTTGPQCSHELRELFGTQAHERLRA